MFCFYFLDDTLSFMFQNYESDVRTCYFINMFQLRYYYYYYTLMTCCLQCMYPLLMIMIAFVIFFTTIFLCWDLLLLRLSTFIAAYKTIFYSIYLSFKQKGFGSEREHWYCCWLAFLSILLYNFLDKLSFTEHLLLSAACRYTHKEKHRYVDRCARRGFLWQGVVEFTFCKKDCSYVHLWSLFLMLLYLEYRKSCRISFQSKAIKHLQWKIFLCHACSKWNVFNAVYGSSIRYMLRCKVV
jgi:hypothetical protein